jgi:putative copper resistance protein D
VLHLVAASAWVGALVPLAIVISSALAHSDPAASAVARETVLRFSTLGAVSVGTLVATGLVNSVVILGSLRALTGTNYGRLLLFKVVLFFAMLSLAAVNRLRLTPIIRKEPYAALAAFERLRTNAFVEAAIGLVILAVVGLLGTTSPNE